MLCDTTLEKITTVSIQRHFDSWRHPNTILQMNQNVIIILCPFPLFTMDTDGVGCVPCADGGNTFAEGLFLVILQHVLLTGN